MEDSEKEAYKAIPNLKENKYLERKVNKMWKVIFLENGERREANTIFRSKMAAIKYSNTYLKSKGRSIYDCIIVKVC